VSPRKVGEDANITITYAIMRLLFYNGVYMKLQ